jgi:hypothetical protein
MIGVSMRRGPKLEWFDLPSLTIGVVADVVNLRPETILSLVKKGCLKAERSTEGRLILRRVEIIHWEKEYK